MQKRGLSYDCKLMMRRLFAMLQNMRKTTVFYDYTRFYMPLKAEFIK